MKKYVKPSAEYLELITEPITVVDGDLGDVSGIPMLPED